MREIAAFLGVSALVILTPGQDTALTIRNTLIGGPADVAPPPAGAATALRQGLVGNLGKPKMLVFFTSLLPQFAGSAGGLLTFGLVFCFMTMVWLTADSFVVARAGDFHRRRRIRRTVEGLTGAVLVALGLRLAGGHR